MFASAVNSKRLVQLFHRTVSTCTSPDPQSSRSSVNFDPPPRSRTPPPVVLVEDEDKELSYSQVHDASCSSSLVDNARSTPEIQGAHATGKGKSIHDYHQFVRPKTVLVTFRFLQKMWTEWEGTGPLILIFLWMSGR